MSPRRFVAAQARAKARVVLAALAALVCAATACEQSAVMCECIVPDELLVQVNGTALAVTDVVATGACTVFTPCAEPTGCTTVSVRLTGEGVCHVEVTLTDGSTIVDDLQVARYTSEECPECSGLDTDRDVVIDASHA